MRSALFLSGVMFGVAGLCACAVQKPSDFADQAIGVSIDRAIEAERRPGSYANRIGWIEKTYELPNGNWVRVVPLDTDCLVHWEVNKDRIIVGYRLLGAGCH
jgi:hypothetical protein